MSKGIKEIAQSQSNFHIQNANTQQPVLSFVLLLHELVTGLIMENWVDIAFICSFHFMTSNSITGLFCLKWLL